MQLMYTHYSKMSSRSLILDTSVDGPFSRVMWIMRPWTHTTRAQQLLRWATVWPQ